MNNFDISKIPVSKVVPRPFKPWAYDPQRSDPSFYASQPLGEWTLSPSAMGEPRSDALFPGSVSHKYLQDISNFVSGAGPSAYDKRPTSIGQLSYKVGDASSFAAADQYAQGLRTYANKAFQAGFINPSQLSEAARSSLSMGSDYLNTGTIDWSKLGQGITANMAKYPAGNPAGSQRSALPYTQSDLDIIRSGTDKIVYQERLYNAEILNRIRDGRIKLNVPKTSFWDKALMAAPGIIGSVFGGPVGGAIGGAISGGISGGGLKGAALGALAGGVAGNGGLGNTLSGLGGPTGGVMNTITSALRGVATSDMNPFGWLGGGLQDLFGDNAFTRGAGSALSLAGPGALIGGALDGWDGALYGGLGGGMLGLGLLGSDTIVNGTYGSGGGFMDSLFGGGGASGGAGGGLFGGGSSGGLLGGLLGGGGGNSLLGLLGGAGTLALLTNEAKKVSDTPTRISTPFSSVNNGVTTLDTTIRNSFLDTMDKSYGLFNQAGGNQGAFVQARVNPLMQQVAQQQGALERSLGLRGVSGSSFGDQAMTSFGMDTGRALGDARALATQEGLAMQGQFNQQLASGGEQMLRQELGSLQFGDQNIQNLLARAKIRSDIFGRAAAGAAGLLGA